MPINFSTFGLRLSALIFIGCSSSTEQESVDTQVESEVVPLNQEPIDLSVFDYILPKSDYVFKIKVTDIDTTLVKDAFTLKADEYSAPEKVDGYYLSIRFSMTNPYGKEMMAPVPDYFYISSLKEDEWFTESTTYHRGCKCEIDNQTDITTDQGEELYNVSEGKCGYDDYCLRYQSGETKEFILNFTSPIYGKVKNLIFWGFDRKWKNPGPPVIDKDNVLVIDIEKEELTGEVKF